MIVMMVYFLFLSLLIKASTTKVINLLYLQYFKILYEIIKYYNHIIYYYIL